MLLVYHFCQNWNLTPHFFELYPHECVQIQSLVGICQWNFIKNTKHTTADNETTVVVQIYLLLKNITACKSAIGSCPNTCADHFVPWRQMQHAPQASRVRHLFYCLKVFRNGLKCLLPQDAGSCSIAYRASFPWNILTRNTSFRPNAPLGVRLA